MQLLEKKWLEHWNSFKTFEDNLSGKFYQTSLTGLPLVWKTWDQCPDRQWSWGSIQTQCIYFWERPCTGHKTSVDLLKTSLVTEVEVLRTCWSQVHNGLRGSSLGRGIGNHWCGHGTLRVGTATRRTHRCLSRTTPLKANRPNKINTQWFTCNVVVSLVRPKGGLL